MSGPKCYNAYTMSAFEGQLNGVLNLQVKLKELYNQLCSLEVKDDQFNVYLNKRELAAEISSRVEKALQPLIFDYKGSFNQNIYDMIRLQIKEQISLTEALLQQINQAISEFRDDEADYSSFITLLRFYEKSETAFNELKERLLIYYQSKFASTHPEAIKSATDLLNEIRLHFSLRAPEPHLRNKLEEKKQEILNDVLTKEQEIQNIRTQTNKAILQATPCNHEPLSADSTYVIGKETMKIVNKIMNLIKLCDDTSVGKIYLKDLEKLQKSASMRDIYFYKELHDSILVKEGTRKEKKHLQKLLVELRETTLHSELIEKKDKLISQAIHLLGNDKIKKSEADLIKQTVDNLFAQSRKLTEEEKTREKERLFIKTQLIHSLEKKGYEIMDDLEVIDFEKNSDFLLKINEQENYLNLIFKEDGSFRYSFQIHENTDDLDTDQLNKKLSEMQLSCDAFKDTLRELESIGLNFEIKTDTPAEASNLLHLTRTNKEKLKSVTTQSAANRKRQIAKKYLTL